MTSCQAQLVEHLIRPDMTALVLDLFRLVPSATNMRVNTLHTICHGFVQVILNTITSTNLTLDWRPVLQGSPAVIRSCSNCANNNVVSKSPSGEN